MFEEIVIQINNNRNTINNNENGITALQSQDPRVKLPYTLSKLVSSIKTLKEKVSAHKQTADDISHDIKNIEKSINQYIKKYTKEEKKTKTERKPSGFAVPTTVSDELCVFMDKEKGTQISRPQATSYLAKYIKDNNLKNVTNKNIILPDEKLRGLLGEDCKNQTITHFNIQKLMNKHFIRKTQIANTIRVDTNV
jgi:chromatin remodeling complex protein RSC6